MNRFLRWLEHTPKVRRRRRLEIEQLEDRCVLSAWFVAPGGSDLASGTIDQPFANIQHALNQASQPGDSVTVRAGTYQEKLVFPSSGDATGAITLQAYAGERPLLDGTGVAGSNMVLMQNVSYVQLIGFEIANNTGVNDGSGVRIIGAGAHIEIRDNIIHDMRGQSAMGITVYGTAAVPISDLIIDNNEIYNSDPSPSEALTLNGNVTNFEVTNNRVHDVNNIGIDLIGGETDIHPTEVVRNGVVRGNAVYRARSNYGGGYAAGIYVDGARDIVLENNVSYQNDLGLEVGAENPGIVASGIVVRNNLIYDNDKAGIVFGGYDATAGRVQSSTFVNNTVYRNDTLNAGQGQLWIQYASNNVVASNIFQAGANNVLLSSDAGNVNNTLDYNLWFSDGGSANAEFTWNGTTYGTFVSYRSGTGQDAGSRFANALFVNAAGRDFHLTDGSPAIDAGSAAAAQFAPTDFDGLSRPQRLRADAGAFEKPPGVTDPNRVITQTSLALQPVGVPFIDPGFGSTLRRVSNTSNSGSFETQSYSQLQAFSADNAYLLLESPNGWLVRRMSDFSRVTLGDTNWNAVRWHPTMPHVLVHYDGNDDNVIRVQYTDVDTGVTSTVFTFPTQYRTIRVNQSFDELSRDGRWMAGMAQRSDGEQVIFSLDLVNRRFGAVLPLHYLYTTHAQPDPVWGEVEPDWIGVSPLGRYLVVQWARDGRAGGSGLETFDIQTGQFVGRVYDGHQHGDMNVLPDGTTEIFMTWEIYHPDGNLWAGYRLLPGRATVSPPVYVRSFSWDVGNHISGQGPDGVFVISGGHNPSNGWSPFEGEVFLLYTDGRVLRLAHARSSEVGYWVQPRATISRDGRYIVFASDWGRGNPGPEGLGMGDPYVIDLGSAVTPVPPPPPPPPPPVTPAIIVTAADAGAAPWVRVYAATTRQLKFRILAYGGTFRGGVRVAVGDVNGDDVPDIITAPGAGLLSRVKIFSGVDGRVLHVFQAYGDSFRGGVFVAAGDVNGDGRADIITGADAGAWPRVKVFSGVNRALLWYFNAYATTFRGGVRVAAADINGDGLADVITAPGAGRSPLVRVYNGASHTLLRQFFAYRTDYRGGVNLAAGDVNGDGNADVITGMETGPWVKAFSGANGAGLRAFRAFAAGGVRVAAADANADGIADLVAAAAPGRPPLVRVLDGLTLAELDAFFAQSAAFLGGVFVGGGE